MGVLTKIRDRNPDSTPGTAETRRDEPQPTAVDQVYRFEDGDDPNSLQFAPQPTTPPIPCLICECPAVWFSIYDVPGPADDGSSASPQARCCLCDPPPGRSLVASRWLLVLVSGNWEWEEFPMRDLRRDPWRPSSIGLPANGQTVNHPGGPAAGGEAAAAKPADGTATAAAASPIATSDETTLAYDRPPRTLAELFPGTLRPFRTPAEFTTPWGTLLAMQSGWNDLVRLTARFGFDEAWRMLGERSEAIFSRGKL